MNMLTFIIVEKAGEESTLAFVVYGHHVGATVLAEFLFSATHYI